MAEFRLGRVKFNWTGDWAVNKSYLIDDIVKFGETPMWQSQTTRQPPISVTFIPTTFQTGIFTLKV